MELDPEDAFFCTNDNEITMRCSPASCDNWWPHCKPRPVNKPSDFPTKCLGDNMPCEVYSTSTISHEALVRSGGNHKIEFDDDDDGDKKHSKHNNSNNNSNKKNNSSSKGKPAVSGGGVQSSGSGGSAGGGGGGGASGGGGGGGNAGSNGDGISAYHGPAPSLAEGSSFDQGSTFNGGSFEESGRRASGSSSSPTLKEANGVSEPLGTGSGAGSVGGAKSSRLGSSGEGANAGSPKSENIVESKNSKPMGLAALNYDPSSRGIVEQSGESAEGGAKGTEIMNDQANSEKSERYTDPWMDYVSVESRKTLVDKLAKSKELREKLRAKIKEVSKRDKAHSDQEKEKLDYYESALLEAEAKIRNGSLEALAPLEAKDAFSMDGDETEREIRRLVSALDSEAAGVATKDEGIHYSLFPRVHRALWRQISNGKIPLRVGGRN